MRQNMDRICDSITRHGRPGRQATAIAGLTLYCAQHANKPVNTIYRPTLCIVAQGRKQVVLGDRILAYDASKYLVVTVDLPVSGCIVEASPAVPYLGASFDLDPARLADLLLNLPPASSSQERRPAAMAVSALGEELLDPLARLLAMLDRPDDITVMVPLIEREIYYRLLQGEQGALLRQVATAGSHLSQIARAIDWIRENYTEPARIEDLAAHAGMSLSSFHRHFKAITTMSPLQYRTQFRLQEARRLMLVDELKAGTVAFNVGYDNPSQFSREYRRMFGLPPAADAARLRRAEAAGS